MSVCVRAWIDVSMRLRACVGVSVRLRACVRLCVFVCGCRDVSAAECVSGAEKNNQILTC